LNPFKKEKYIVWSPQSADRVLVERNWFQLMLYPTCFATLTECLKAGRITVKKESKKSAEIFVDHIKSHLKPGENVICKICGKTVEEIYLENKHP